MWSLALASLAVLAVAVDCACPRGNEPLNKTMLRLTMSGPMTWKEVARACRQQFGIDFEMLGRDFLFLSDSDKASCRGHSVPLRIEKHGLEQVIWPGKENDLSAEKVNSTYLTHMRADEVPPMSTGWQVGSLSLSTGQWRLVDNNTHFSCAICQRAWTRWLGLRTMAPPLRPGILYRAFTFRLVETGRNSVGLDEALRVAEQRLNTLTQDSERILIKAKIVKVEGKDGDGNGTLLRLMTSWWWLEPEHVMMALNGSYSLESSENKDYCPATTFKGHNWEKSSMGRVAKVKLQDSQVATRRCWWRLYPDGDLDAVWEDQVLVWIDRFEDCQAHAISNFLRRLKEFAERDDLGSSDIKSLVEITADTDELTFPRFDWEHTAANYSRELVGALSSLLVATATNLNASSACQGVSCVLLAADLQGAVGPNTVMFSSENVLPTFLNLNESSAANQTNGMSLQLLQALTSTGRVAVHTWRYLDAAYRDTVAVQVVSTRYSNESEPESSRPPVTFHFNNPTIFEDDWSNFREVVLSRYWSVLVLGESGEPTQPCPLVRSKGLVDTYSCNKWERLSRNFTAGTFLTNSFGGYYRETIRSSDPLKSVLLAYTTIPLDESVLLMVVNFTNLLIKQGDAELNQPSRVDELSPWQEILSGVVLTEPVIKVGLEHVKVLVSDLTVDDPVVGFSLPRLDGADAVQTFTTSSRNDVSAKSAVDLVLGGDFQEHCKQLAILAVSRLERFRFESPLGKYIKRNLMVVHLVATAASSGNVYFDIQLRGDREGGEKGDADVNNTMLRFQVATWSEADGDWFVSSCAKRRSTRASKSVVRCESLTVDDGALRGRYLVFEPVGFAEALGPTFLAVLIAAGVLSGVSLTCIAATAAFLPAWRKDIGHKILLQMTLALAFNLALGFTSSFLSVDTARVACVVIGALRHFSFLAMFAWMLVMSGLQLRRLLSVLGARITSNLLLKVSFFAWGVPTIAVGSLLIFNLDMYQSDAADRGYCYPEGDAFTWSVQAPAATVLALNAFIFVVILARLYGFLGWGKTMDLQRHLNERTFQMRRVRAVFFTFFLFGLTWLFHLLAEQGVLKVKFLFEYLFLMTASVHVFALSCIFVFLDPEARAEWVQVVAPVTGRWSLGSLR